MPKFKITGPDGRTVTLEGATEPSEQELDQIFSEMDTPAPDSGVWDSVKSGAATVTGRGLDVLGRVTGTLNRLGVGAAHAVDEGIDTLQGEQSVGQGLSDFAGKLKDTFTPAGEGISGKLQNIGKWKDNTDFNKVLENQGVEDILKKYLGEKGGDWATAGLGFVGDVALDPLRVGAVNKLASKGIGALGSGVASAVKTITPDAVQSALKKGFVADYSDMAKYTRKSGELNLADDIRLINSSQRHAREMARDTAQDVFTTGEKRLFRHTPEAPLAQRTAFSHAMDQGKAVPTGLEKQAETWKSTMDQIWAEKQTMGSTVKLLKKDGVTLRDTPKILARKEDNYVGYFPKSADNAEAVVGPAYRTTTRTDKARKGYDTLEEAVRHGNAPEDAKEILETTISMHERAKRTHGFLQMVGKEYGSAKQLPGLRQLDRKSIGVSDKLWLELKDTYFPEDMAGYLERSVKLWEQPQEMDRLWKTGTKLFKGLATSVNVPHHATNFMGNVMNMYTRGGMSMREIGKQMWKAYGLVKKGDDLIVPAIGKYDSATLNKLAREYEVIGTAGHLRDLAEAGTSEKVTNNIVLQVARKFGTGKVEEPARLALWMDGIEKGLTPAQSALKVKNVLLDYAELTPFERRVRDYAIPFYTWARKNPVVQFEGLMMDPKKFANISDFQNIGWNANKEQVDESVIPQEWIDRGMIPGAMQGENGELVMQRLGLPQTDLNKLANPVGMVMEGLHPLLKAPMELYTNQRGGGGEVKTKSGFAPPSAIASAVSALVPDQIEQMIPEALQGYVNVANVGGRPRQRDYASWLMSMVPTGVAGQGAKLLNDDPKSVGIDARPSMELAQRLMGLTPRVLTGEDQKFELQRRKDEWRRKASRVVMDR